MNSYVVTDINKNAVKSAKKVDFSWELTLDRRYHDDTLIPLCYRWLREDSADSNAFSKHFYF
jgi:hypothetical protein